MAGNGYLAKSATGTPQEVLASQTSAGAGDAGKIPALDSTGRLDSSMMPTGIAAPTASIVSSENLAAGDFVNIYNNAGTANVRKADASVSTKPANGFVLAAVTSPAAATVYSIGAENNGVTSLTPGPQFLSATVAGKCTTTVPSGTGQLVQPVGVATSATNVLFQPNTGYILA